jgi:hypothetical protein
MNIMTEEQKIKAPAHIEADRRRAEEREGRVGELKGWLEDRHREALDADPHAPFKSKAPLSVLKALDEREREDVRSFEELAFQRHQEQARIKGAEKRYWTAAGGDGDRFERRWSEGGEDEAVARRAREIRERAENSPY